MSSNFPLIKWSANPPDNDRAGAPYTEGQSAASHNDGGRDLMAAIREYFEASGGAGWWSYGSIADNPTDGHDIAWGGGDSFVVNGLDGTEIYSVDRRVRVIGSSTGTVYATITASVFSGGNTTVTVDNDAGSFVNEPLAVSVGPKGSVHVPSIFAAGTRIPFYSAAPPAGWSLVSGLGNHVLMAQNTGGGVVTSSWIISGLSSSVPGQTVRTDSPDNNAGAQGGTFHDLATNNHNHNVVVASVAASVSSSGAWRPPNITVCIGNYDG